MILGGTTTAWVPKYRFHRQGSRRPVGGKGGLVVWSTWSDAWVYLRVRREGSMLHSTGGFNDGDLGTHDRKQTSSYL